MIQSLDSNNIFKNCKIDTFEKLGLNNTESNFRSEKIKIKNSRSIYGSEYSSIICRINTKNSSNTFN